MPLRLDISRELSARSERVKCVDIHPTEPWVLASLFSGIVTIWDYSTETMLKSFEASDVPVRAAKFIPRMQWFVCGADDLKIRVYNYNTMEKVHHFEGHSDYIRALAVHPKSPYLLSSSDDMSIKMWDWSRNWELVQAFEGHSHYVMQVEFNPKDSNTFASASLDRSIKVWGLNSRTPHFSLEGHERGVNCISYYSGGDRPYIVSGADDQTLKVWDYQTKACIATLEGHTNNVSAVMFHPVLPILLSGSEDGTIRLWHSATFRLENTLNYGMERVWSLACHKESNRVAIGFDDGAMLVKIGHEEPVVSMDRNGKVVWAKNHDIIGTNVRMAAGEEFSDGERLPLVTKEMGSCEIYPQDLAHDPKARLLAVCGDGEYIIYTALSLKNKKFGHALGFVWASQSGFYATRESASRVCVFKNFETYRTLTPSYSVEGIYGGACLALRSDDFVDFYDWESGSIVRRIEVVPRNVYWSESGDICVLALDVSFYVLNFNAELVAKYATQGIEVGDQGIDGSFELEKEVPDSVTTAQFVGDCMIYTTSNNRLNYYVGGEVITLAHLDKPYYLLGYLQKENKVYLIDRQHNIVCFNLLLSVLIYETAIVRRDMEAAADAFEAIPADHHDKLSRFLEAQGLLEDALRVTTDPEHQFELAIQLNKLTLARELASQDESSIKWKQVGDAALAAMDLPLARLCFERANDLSSLLLLTTSLADKQGVEALSRTALSSGRFNVAFASLFMCGQIDACIEVLVKSGRIPEAAIMARSYAPSQVARLVELWRNELATVNKPAADAIGNPQQHPELFPDLSTCLKAERYLKHQMGEKLPARSYETTKQRRERDLFAASERGELEEFEASAVPDVQEPLAEASSSAASQSSRTASPLQLISPRPSPQDSDEEVPLETSSPPELISPRPSPQDSLHASDEDVPQERVSPMEQPSPQHSLEVTDPQSSLLDVSDPFSGLDEGELGTSDDLFASLSLDAAEEESIPVPAAAAADNSSAPAPEPQMMPSEPAEESFDFSLAEFDDLLNDTSFQGDESTEGNELTIDEINADLSSFDL